MEKPLTVQGYLFCKLNGFWKKRWCELKGECLNLHSPESKKLTGTVKVTEVQSFEDYAQLIFFENAKNQPKYGFVCNFVDNKPRLLCCTASVENTKQWLEALKESLIYYQNLSRIRNKMEQNLTWLSIHSGTDETPCERFGHSMTPPLICRPKKIGFLRASVSGRMKRSCNVWLFGGRRGMQYLNDLWEFYFPDILDHSGLWQKATFQGQVPIGRYGHSAVIYGKYMIIFAGKTPVGPSDDLHLFHTETQIWSRPIFEGRAPRVRYNHTSTIVGNEMVIIGGRSSSEIFSDVHVLNLDTLKWREIVFTEAQRDEKIHLSEHTSTLVGPTLLYIFGGYDGTQVHNTLWMFDFKSKAWVRPITKGTPPPPRRKHVATLVNKNLFIYGGRSVDNLPLSDVYYLCTESLTWYRSPVGGSYQPEGRHSHTSFELSNILFAFGGKADNKRVSGDVYALVTKPLEKQWHDRIAEDPTEMTCNRCNLQVAENSSYVEFVSSGAVLHQDCLLEQLEESSIQSVIQMNAKRPTTDLFFLISFIERIFEDKAHPLSMNLQKFANEFVAEYSNVHTEDAEHYYIHVVEEINVYLKSFCGMIISNVKLIDCPEGREFCTKALVKQLFPLIYDPLFHIFSLKYVKENALFASRIDQLQSFTTETLGLQEKFVLKRDEGDEDTSDPYQGAIDVLCAMFECRNPLEKMDCLVLVRHALHHCIVNFYQRYPHKKHQDSYLCGDDLLVLFQYLLMRARPLHLRAEIQFIKTFLQYSFTSGEMDYCLTTLEVAMDAINAIPTDGSGYV